MSLLADVFSKRIAFPHYRRHLWLFLLIWGAVVPVSSVAAQAVTGQVVDSISGISVGSGFVVLLDAADREVARTLSAADGRFRLEAPAGGFYKLRSERIGYTAFTSTPFEIGANQTLDRTLRVLAQAIVLAAVQVQGEDRCNTNPAQAEETGVVWQEIRKALAASAWDGTQELARYRRYGYEREWDANRSRVRSERGSIIEAFAGQPFRSIPVEQLASEGYVVERADGTWYNLPDAGVLQDDVFLETHCFHVVRDTLAKRGQIGLAFEPMSPRGVPDVRGALWLDESTSELRVLEVAFTQLPENLDNDRVGGTIEFLKLPSGAWIIHRWQVRKPIIRVVTAGNRVIVEGKNRRVAVVGFNDTGADVLEITTRDGMRLYPPGVAHLTGTVYDSTKTGPLGGALVSIEGTSLWGRSNARGEFRLTVPFEGEYSAILTHPWIDSIGLTSPRRDVRFVAENTDTTSFVLPHANSVARRLCSHIDESGELGTLVGSVRDARSGEPASGVDISATWQILTHGPQGLIPRDVEQVVETSELGSYVLCGLPLGHQVTVEVEGARSVNILYPRQEGGALLLARDREAGQAYPQSFQTGHRTWKVDLLLTGARPDQRSDDTGQVVSGYVTDRSTSAPVAGVTISFNGADTTVTRADGTFDIVGVDWAPDINYIATRRLGYAPWGQEIWVEEATDRLDLSIQLEQQAVSVDPVEVTAEAVERVLTEVGFYARQRVNSSYFMEREQVERRLGSAMYVTELLNGVPGIDVIDAPLGQFGSTVRFRGIMSMERNCGPPRTMVDGVAIEFETLENLVRPEDVFAIEAYRRPSEVPTEYRGANSACGVLLIWTRRGR